MPIDPDSKAKTKMTELAVLPMRPNRERATAALARIESGAPRGSTAAAQTIAATAAAAVGRALETAVPYSSRGATLETEIEISHRAADGSQTAATVRMKYVGK